MSIDRTQRLAGLRFYLYDRPLHPELFRIYRDERIARPAYEARIWVTGCSHVIAFFRGNRSLVEVTAGNEIHLPERGLLVELPLKGERDHEFRQTDGIDYMMNFQVETMSPAVYVKSHDDLAARGRRKGLFVPFPSWSTGELTPFSYISYQAKPAELHIFAFHALPADLSIVKTQSIFELG